MTVLAGDEALALDYEALADRVDDWFTSDCTACVFGNVNQVFGWGGTTTPLVVTGDDMEAAQMNEIIDRCNIGVNMTSVAGSLTRIVAGNSVLATQYNNADAKEILIRAQKNLIVPTELSLYSGISDSRTTNYSTAINCIIRYTFSDFDHARYFFNSGGAINLVMTISGYSTGTGYDGEGMNEIFTTMGTITTDYNLTTQSGSGGTTTTIGYYDLTTGWQQIFNQAGSGVYSNATFVLQARRSASGDYVEINIICTPEAGRVVNGTTTATSQFRRLDDQSSGSEVLTITSPVPTVEDTFE